jgi:hypothetical protein
MIETNKKEYYLKSFFIAFILAFLTFIPVIIADGGVFIYGGDYA